MSGFRIIAIKTGEKPDKASNTRLVKINNPLKVLSPNTVYPFYSFYEFVENNTNEFIYKPEKDVSIYQIKNNSRTTINISAIVGSNGSGKSSLIDLLFLANYNIGCFLKLIKGDSKKTLEAYNNLNIEIIYTVGNNTYYKLIFKDKFVGKLVGKCISNKVIFKDSSIQSSSFRFKESELSEFFYSIIINYSHYALNSNEIGNWIQQLFHKNDGYQTPIVLNPMRTSGNIDINKETRLLNRRLQANILEYVEKGNEQQSLRNIVNNKVAKLLNLRLMPLTEVEKKEDEYKPFSEETKKKLIFELNNQFGLQLSKESLENDIFQEYSFEYICRKLFKISRTYKQFTKYKDDKDIKYINAYVDKIKGSKSHIVFKIKGVILYLKYYHQIFGSKKFTFLDRDYKIEIEDLSNFILKIKEEEKFFINTFMMAPPSFFKTEIIFESSISLDTLSSGEKQRIHSISSIVYHLVNLNSVEEEDEVNLKFGRSNKIIDDPIIHYKNINIVLDEIELYYHPDWQRRYISDLINYIEKINPNSLNTFNGINIVFLTHSPYILSDIPGQNILFLKIDEDTGYSKPQSLGINTFGANIYDLLKNGFFMENGFIGEWAKETIERTLNWLKSSNKQNQEYYKQIIEIVGEPIIRSRLRDMYNEKYDEPTYEELLAENKRLKGIS